MVRLVCLVGLVRLDLLVCLVHRAYLLWRWPKKNDEYNIRGIAHACTNRKDELDKLEDLDELDKLEELDELEELDKLEYIYKSMMVGCQLGGGGMES